MPTKIQSRTAIDNACTDIKNDIDNILPVGVNIKDGHVSFGPTRYTIILDAGGIINTAISWMNSIDLALTTATRAHKIIRGDRRISPDNLISDNPKQITIVETKLTIIITNF